jgi:hypothetical protein
MPRKATRDDSVKNALVNLIEDLASAQLALDAGNGGVAKQEVDGAVARFRAIANAGVRELIVAVDLGRLRLTIDYADDLGEINATYLARRLCD